MIKSALSSILVVVACAFSVQANNNSFLPGDAFFAVALTESEFARLSTESDTDRVFQYGHLGDYPAVFLAATGFHHAHFESIDKEFMNNLSNAYSRMRKLHPASYSQRDVDGKAIQYEDNPLVCLIYRNDFDLNRFHLGLRYNETWFDELGKFSPPAPALRLGEFVANSTAVEESWRDSKIVPSFDCTLPKAPWKLAPLSDTNQPRVHVHGEVKAVVLPPTNRRPNGFAYRAEKSKNELFAIQSLTDLYEVTCYGTTDDIKLFDVYCVNSEKVQCLRKSSGHIRWRPIAEE